MTDSTTGALRHVSVIVRVRPPTAMDPSCLDWDDASVRIAPPVDEPNAGPEPRTPARTRALEALCKKLSRPQKLLMHAGDVMVAPLQDSLPHADGRRHPLSRYQVRNPYRRDEAFTPAGWTAFIVLSQIHAFGYLADSYGLNFLAPVGIDTEAEPSASELAALIAHLKETGAGALFVENITSSALIEQISKETGLKVGGRLFSEALSERGGPATSYIAMFEHNLGAIMTALQDSGS